jgi:hypothetical protein
MVIEESEQMELGPSLSSNLRRSLPTFIKLLWNFPESTRPRPNSWNSTMAAETVILSTKSSESSTKPLSSLT